MLCIAAFIVLSILGIFSATHRKLAREAMDCVFRRVTLRPCNTGFDVKIKSQILGNLITRSPRLAQFVSRRFEVLSWMFMILMVGSTVWAGRGIYNYWAYGSCNGLNASGFCVFDPKGESNKVSLSEAECRAQKPSEKDLTLEGIDFSIFPFQKTGSGKQLTFIGCYACDYTRKTWPTIQELLETTPMQFRFIHFPSKPQSQALMPYDYCVQAQKPEGYLAFVNTLFASPLQDVISLEATTAAILASGADPEVIEACSVKPETQAAVQKRIETVEMTGIYGTPMVLVEKTWVVGPKPERVYKRLLK